MKAKYSIHIYKVTGAVEKTKPTKKEAVDYAFKQFQKPDVYKVKVFDTDGTLKLHLV